MKDFILMLLYTVVVFLLGGILLDVLYSEPLRGYQIGTFYNSDIDKTLDTAHSHGASVIRYQIVNPENPAMGVGEYTTWWLSAIDKMLSHAAHAKSKNIKFIVDMHTAPNGTLRRGYGDQHWILTRAGFDWWVYLWQAAIQKIEADTNADVIIAYDLINEPAAKSSKVLWKKYKRIIGQLRPYTNKAFIITHKRGGIRDLNKLTPIRGFGDIWITTHTYKPNALGFYTITPQFMSVDKMQAAALKMQRRGRRLVRRSIRPLRKFQNKYNVIVYVGEYGISARVPDEIRAHAAEIVLGQLNRWNMNWTFHALDEFHLWQPFGKTAATIKSKMN